MAFPLYHQPPGRPCVPREGLAFLKENSSDIKCRGKKTTTLIPAWFYLQLWLPKPLSWSSTLTPPILVPWFSRCQHLQADRDPDQSPLGPAFPMDSVSPRCLDHPRLGALSEAQAYQPTFPESPQSGNSWQAQFTGECGQMAGWLRQEPLFLVSPICQSGSKWGKMGKEEGMKGMGYLTSRKIIIWFFKCCI